MKENNADIVYEFCSTSKISFAGSGISAMAASFENLKYIERKMSVQTIGNDKINQLRHVKYFKNNEKVLYFWKESTYFIKQNIVCTKKDYRVDVLKNNYYLCH